jgi:hypothetical protein
MTTVTTLKYTKIITDNTGFVGQADFEIPSSAHTVGQPKHCTSPICHAQLHALDTIRATKDFCMYHSYCNSEI